MELLRRLRECGIDSSNVVLPDEDMAAFEEMRNGLFARYRPRTFDEALCVDKIASYEWRIARCHEWQAVFEAKAMALLTGGLDGVVTRKAEAEGNRWLRTLKESEREEDLLVQMMTRAEKEITRIRKQRQKDLGAHVTDGQAEGYRHAPVVRRSDVPAVAPQVPSAPAQVSPAHPVHSPAASVTRPVPARNPETRESGTMQWRTNHAPIHENGDAAKRKSHAEWNRLLQQLRPTVGHG